MLLEQMPWQDYYKDKLEVLLPIILQRRPDEAQTLLLELLEKVQIYVASLQPDPRPPM